MSVTLFVYGTLAPGQPAWPLLAPYVARRSENAVPGCLYDTGRGYPGAVFGENPGADMVHGWCCALVEPPQEALDALDDFEGGEYERVTVRCVDGTEALALRVDRARRRLRAGQRRRLVRGDEWVARRR
jgi:gamma-glutamylcyclotransferase (GGCT)/AIG2-like uncharacterized protein YtfP